MAKTVANTIQAIRGMHDILPQDMPAWQMLEAGFRELVHSYGYTEIRMPVVEKTELFVRTIGEVTDIVEKEMYTFEDLNGDQLTLRPEGTAGCVRACIEHGLIYNQVQRLWYGGPMFRHERPQKGRYRQFFQMGAEAYGMAGPDIDAELILLTARLWKKLGIQGLQLQLNSLGSREARRHYRDILVEYMSAHMEQLDEDSKRRLHSNPLRILDSKNPAMQALINAAPRLADSLDDESAQHFSVLLDILDNAGVAYTVNPRLVRGLDYYEKTVFEWVSDRLGAQGTVCAGGRYDGLIEHLGGRPTPAAGFALGMERLLSLMAEDGVQSTAVCPHLYFIIAGDGLASQGLALAESLRDWRPGLRVMVNCSEGSFKSQMKKADKSDAPLALILAEDEAQRGEIAVKFLRREKPQETVSQTALTSYLGDIEEINC